LVCHGSENKGIEDIPIFKKGISIEKIKVKRKMKIKGKK
jgi:hypothetical protein